MCTVGYEESADGTDDKERSHEVPSTTPLAAPKREDCFPVTTETRRRTGELSAHRQAVDESPDAIASFLVELLGASLTAHLAAVDESTVRRWASGDKEPRAENERTLRNASQIARLLLHNDASHTVRAWFIGMNPQLDDEAPADVIREGRFREAMAAAKAFMHGA
jgi:hypothetical protein